MRHLTPITPRFVGATFGLLLAALPAAAAEPDPALIARGQYLATAGDCVACHSAPGGQPFAGGVAIDTPFGSIYPPNITSDKATGIGAWNDDQFYRALHEGVGKDGEYLYPALPYQWYTKVTREDVRAIKAYLDTVPAVNAPPKKNTMIFPFNVRLGLAGWNAVYLHKGEFQPDPAKSEEMNRGAYLVEGLGHCGDCHTPKGVTKSPIESRAFSGGMIDNWYAPNITSDVDRGIGGWSVDELTQYLRTGAAPGKGVVVGPMAQVITESLSKLNESDVRAIAVYLKAIPPIADYQEARPTGLVGPHATGAETYLSNCAFCHQVNGQGIQGAIPALDGNGAVQAKGPENVIRVILGGHMATDSYALMPAVGAAMSDADIAEVTNYVRATWSNGAPATAEAGTVGAIRKLTNTMLSGSGADACNADEVKAIAPIADPRHELQPMMETMDSSNMSPRINQIVGRVKQVAPKTSQADIVNGLTVAYCPVVAKRNLSPDAGRELLTRFSQLVYTQLVSGQKD